MNPSPTGHPAPGLHPLEAIMPFRRLRRTPLHDIGYTLVLNCLVALVLTAAGQVLAPRPDPLLASLGAMLLRANLAGFLIHGALAALRRLAPIVMAQGGRDARRRQLVVIGIGAFCGVMLGQVVLHWATPLKVFGSDMVMMVLVSTVFSVITIRVMLLLVERRVARATALARQQEQIATASRLLAEARLRALQAQIEPHFLYNTLANVLGLIDTRPAEARRMLERFIDYLRASLAASRAESATLGGELDQVSAYLDVLAVRMGARLRYRVEADAQCRTLPIAPMLLQPLVENAVMHGIEPKLAGGEIVVRTRVDGDVLCIEVADSGLGLGRAPQRPGGGVGLANLRERVRQLHGPQARLQLFDNQPCGVTARLLLPLLVPSSTPPLTPPAP
ncbi:MAG: histidine kinase [Telluria sp.]